MNQDRLDEAVEAARNETVSPTQAETAQGLFIVCVSLAANASKMKLIGWFVVIFSLILLNLFTNYFFPNPITYGNLL